VEVPGSITMTGNATTVATIKHTIYCRDICNILQGYYLDRETNTLIPNLVFLDQNGQILFETNEVGLKGEKLDPARQLAIVWGDSVIFALGQGWVHLLNSYNTKFQFLNGGIEGINFKDILKRAVEMNEKLGNVALNVVFPGWHDHGHNAGLREALLSSLPKMRNPVLANMPTALNERIINEDISPYFSPTSSIAFEDGFNFYGSYEYSIHLQKEIYEFLIERNTIIKDVAIELNLPFIDVFTAFESSSLPDFTQYFFDVMHPRIGAFPKFATTVYQGIKHLVETPC
jgi:hypothetical protein